jgi:hypothetical protein
MSPPLDTTGSLECQVSENPACLKPSATYFRYLAPEAGL